MRKMKQAFLVTFAAALLVFALQNTHFTQIKFLWLQTVTPLVMLVFLTTAGGFVSGLLVALLLIRRSDAAASKNKDQPAAAE